MLSRGRSGRAGCTPSSRPFAREPVRHILLFQWRSAATHFENGYIRYLEVPKLIHQYVDCRHTLTFRVSNSPTRVLRAWDRHCTTLDTYLCLSLVCNVSSRPMSDLLQRSTPSYRYYRMHPIRVHELDYHGDMKSRYSRRATRLSVCHNMPPSRASLYAAGMRAGYSVARAGVGVATPVLPTDFGR